MENDIFEIFQISCITWLSAQGFSLGLDLARSPPLRWKKSKFYHFFKFNLLLGVGGFLQTIQICYCLLSTWYLFSYSPVIWFWFTCYFFDSPVICFLFTCYCLFFTCYCLFFTCSCLFFTCYCLFIHLLLLTISSTRVSPPSSSTSWQYLSGLTWNHNLSNGSQKLF